MEGNWSNNGASMRFLIPIWENLHPLPLITICIFLPSTLSDFSMQSTKIFPVHYSFLVSLSNIYMYKVISKVDNQWVHLVLNFIVSEEGFQVFKDGALVPRQLTKAYFSRPLGDGRLVLGRRHPSTDDFYSSVDLDELVFFNREFTEPEVTELYNNYNWFFLSCNLFLSDVTVLTNLGTVNSLKNFGGKCDQWDLLCKPLIMKVLINWSSTQCRKNNCS